MKIIGPVFVIILLVSLGIVFSGVNLTQADPLPSITLNPTSGRAPLDITVTGSSFSGVQQVRITWDDTLVGTAPINDNGSFNMTIALPSQAIPGPHTIKATEYPIDPPVQEASATFTVYDAPNIILNPTSGHYPLTIKINGSNFYYSYEIFIYWDGDSIPTNPVNIARYAETLDGGSFEATVEIPFGASPGAHTISAIGNSERPSMIISDQATQEEASANFTVLGPVLSASPSSGRAPLNINLTGSHFFYSQQVDITWDNTAIKTVSVDQQAGTFSTFIAVPAQAAPGVHTIKATGHPTEGPIEEGSASFTVLAPAGIALNPTSGRTPLNINITGSNFFYSPQVSITWDNTPISTATVNQANGSFSATISLPTQATTGAHTIIAIGQGSDGQPSATFTVLGPAGIVLNPTSGRVLLNVNVTGSNFFYSSQVSITWDNTPISTATVNPGNGSFSATIVVPSQATPGSHTISAIGQGSDGQPSATFTVLAPAGIVLNPTSGRAPLDFNITGSHFYFSQQVSITWDNTPISTATVNQANGSFSATVPLPSQAVPGSHIITAIGQGSDGQPSATFTVLEPAGIVLNPTFGRAPLDINITGAHFYYSQEVSISWDDSPVSTASVNQVNGSFNATIPLPSQAAPGDYVIRALGLGSDGQPGATFTVLPPPSIALNLTSGYSPCNIIITGAHFHYSQQVAITFNNATMATIPTPIVPSGSGFTASITIPGETAPGTYTIIATGQELDPPASAAFTVLVPPAADIILSPTSGCAVVTISGTGFPLNYTLDISWDGKTIPTVPGPITPSGTPIGGSGYGSFDSCFTVPTQLSPGSHTVLAKSKFPYGLFQDSATFNVTDMKGKNGLAGIQGPAGHRGPAGASVSGNIGSQGPSGAQGQTGDMGPTGIPGDQGSTGPRGPQGDQGDPGKPLSPGYLYLALAIAAIALILILFLIIKKLAFG